MSTHHAIVPPAAFPPPAAPADLERDDLLAPLRGPSESMGRLWSQVKVLAPHFRTLLLTGERGSSAETVARLLQTLSPFSLGPLVTLDLAAGLQTATKRLGSPKRLLQSVAGGVLYLHEVDRLSAEAQVDLSRFLRLNRHHLAALIAFSSRDLRTLAAAGGFSPALAEALGSFSIALPPLRSRRDDLALLADLFLREASILREVGTGSPNTLSLDGSFLEAATAYSWPGNVDQLRSVIQQLSRSARTASTAPTPFTGDDLRSALADADRFERGSESPLPVRLIKLDQVVHEHIRSVLIACQGNKLRAAEVLGISRSTLYRMLDSGPSGQLALLV